MGRFAQLALHLGVAVTLFGCNGGDDDEPPPPGQPSPVTLPDGRVCLEQLVYRDTDGDGYGVKGDSREVCLDEDEEVEGYARASGDCAPGEPLVHPGAPEICGDHLDENCTSADESCPESVSADVKRAEWDCAGDPPSHVLAWARFDDNEYYGSDACFVFYEGLEDEFYVEPVNLEPTPEKAAEGPMGKCEAVEGCICPSIENYSFDRGRLYAFTLRGQPEDCDKIVVMSDAGNEQTVSNACRKFLYQIWFNPNEFSYVGGSEARLRDRLTRFPRVEIACFEGQPFDDLPFASLLTAEVHFNPDFVKR